VKARVIELLNMVEEKALADKAAGRLVWAQEQLELVKAVRQMFSKQKAAQRAAWKRWYDKHGKLARIRREERDARENSQKPK
jgi:hypothetical protein